MTVTKQAWRWHRWLGWLVGLQVLAWVTGGLLFAWVPFEPWVKGGEVLQRPTLAIATLPAGLGDLDPAQVTALAAVATPRGAAWRVRVSAQPQPVYRLVSGAAWIAPDADAVRDFARALAPTLGEPVAVERVGQVPPRLGIVDEAGGRSDLWRVRWSDGLRTRVYLDGPSGEFLALRNEAWVWYDFFWRLHIMDYGGGEDFNNAWLRAASVAAWALVAAGVWLSVMAIRRRLRRT